LLSASAGLTLFGGLFIVSIYCAVLLCLAWWERLLETAQRLCAFSAGILLMSLLKMPALTIMLQIAACLAVALVCLLLAGTKNQKISGGKKIACTIGIFACLRVIESLLNASQFQRAVRQFGLFSQWTFLRGWYYAYAIVAVTSLVCMVFFLLAWAGKLSSTMQTLGVLAVVCCAPLMMKVPRDAVNRPVSHALVVVFICMACAGTPKKPADKWHDSTSSLIG
jgi:hypothetical protein